MCQTQLLWIIYLFACLASLLNGCLFKATHRKPNPSKSFLLFMPYVTLDRGDLPMSRRRSCSGLPGPAAQRETPAPSHAKPQRAKISLPLLQLFLSCLWTQPACRNSVEVNADTISLPPRITVSFFFQDFFNLFSRFSQKLHCRKAYSLMQAEGPSGLSSLSDQLAILLSQLWICPSPYLLLSA